MAVQVQVGLSLGLLLVTSVGILFMVAAVSSDPNCDGQKAFWNSNDQCSYYYDLLEDALINDSDVLYRLKNIFFPSSFYEFQFDVTITVDEIPLGRNCNQSWANRPTFYNRSGEWTAQFLPVWRQFDHEPVSLKDRLEYITSVCLYEAYSFEGAVGLFKYNDQNIFDLCYIAEIEGGTVSIPLHLSKLLCNPDHDVTENALTSLLSWAKAYARAQKRPDSWDESDSGTILPRFSYVYLGISQIYVTRVLLIVFIFLNILVMLLMVRLVPGYYRKLRFNASDSGKRASISIFRGFATVSFLVATVCTIMDLTYFVKVFPFYSDTSALCSIYCCWSTVEQLKTAVYARVVLTPLIFLIELLVSICTLSKKADIYSFFRRANTVSLSCTKSVTAKAVQILALWGIMVFVQHITMSVIMISLLVVKFAAMVLPILACLVSGLFCVVVFTAQLFYVCQLPKSQRKISLVCIQLLAVLVFVGLIISLLSLYISFYYSMKFDFSSVGGFAVSFIPTVVLSAIGWFVRRKLLKTGGDTDEESQESNGGYTQNSAQSVVDVDVDQSRKEERRPLLHTN